MSQNFPEGNLTFSFPNAWKVSRPQGSPFYSRLFQHFCGGCKEMDFVAYDAIQQTLWLIEVKDYSQHPRRKAGDMADELAAKPRDVLALLIVAGFNDNAASSSGSAGGLQIGDFYRQSKAALTLRVVLHCELSPVSSKLFPSVTDAANLQMKLKQKLCQVASNPLFTNRSLGHILPWTVA